ncbi:MAG: mechanosensitive ion channel family protein [Clostridia bacterium]
MAFIMSIVGVISSVFMNLLLPIILKILATVITLAIGYFVAKLGEKPLRGVLSKSGIDDAATGFICSVVKVIVYILAIVMALGNLVEITSLIAALGAAGLTASFALQGSLSNFVSGMQVIFSKPFKIGDFLQVGSYSGTVASITVLNTTLLTIDNKEIIIPNSTMTSDAIINFNSQDVRRLDLTYGVAYSSDLNMVKDVLNSVVKGLDCVIDEPAPMIAVGAHEDSSIQMIVRFWVKSDDYWPTYFFMQEKVKAVFDENKIEIPFPQMDVHTK